MKEKKKRKIRIKGVILLLLIIYLITTIIFYFFKSPIKKINLEGNIYLKENYLVNYLDIKNTPLMQLNKRKIKNKLLEIDLISNAKIKKSIFGKITITITEDKILFYNMNNEKMVLSNGRVIDYNSNYLGVPTLINYVPDDIYNELIKKLDTINTNTISLISEIEYNPSKVNDKIIDENRFLFRMNDGNQVYINTINMEKIANYLEIYEVILNKNGNVTGCLYLDSNSENKYFNDCSDEKVEVDEVINDEL